MLEDLLHRLNDGDDLILAGEWLGRAQSDPEVSGDDRAAEALLWLSRRMDLALGWRPTPEDLHEMTTALAGYADHVSLRLAGQVQAPSAAEPSFCLRDVLVTAPELFVLAEAVRRQGVATVSEPRVGVGARCVLLSPGGRCLGLAGRPLACRLSGDAHKMSAVRRAILAALRAVCLARGWDARAFSLTIGLAAVMREPGLADQWLRGASALDPAARALPPPVDLASEQLAALL